MKGNANIKSHNKYIDRALTLDQLDLSCSPRKFQLLPLTYLFEDVQGACWQELLPISSECQAYELRVEEMKEDENGNVLWNVLKP